MSELDAKDLWSRALEALSGRIAPQTLDAWLRPLGAIDAARTELKGGVLLLSAPNAFLSDWAAKHYGPVIEEVLADLTGGRWTLHWTTQEPASAGAARAPDVPASTASPGSSSSTPVAQLSTAAPAAAASVPPPRRAPSPGRAPSSHAPRMAAVRDALASPPSRAISSGLHPKYTFEHFVSGPSNQLAHAAAVATAQLAGRRFNPLFLCGGTGLGKTHLVNAVGHKILEQKPDARIVYVSAEHFTNEFIASLQSHTMDEFRDRYRSKCDALLLDDVQFLAGREQTQEEFFHTFNALYLQDRPIVLTSDVSPHDLKGMAERLVSRFSSGLVAEIYPPEMETRIAIVRKKAELEGISVEDEAAYLLATGVASNVRDLEGMLMKLAIKASLAGRLLVDAALVRDSLRLPSRPSVLTVEDVQRVVCEHYRVRLSQLTGRERHQGITLPRQVAMYLCREHLGVSFPQIGARFGGKDHTTVISAVNKIRKLLVDNETLRRDLDALKARLGPPQLAR